MKAIAEIIQQDFTSTEKEIPWMLSPDEERIAELEATVAKNDHRRWLAAHDRLSSGESIELLLTESERSEAIRKANKRKYNKSEYDRVMSYAKERKINLENETIKEWDAVRFLRLMRVNSLSLGKKLIETPDKLLLIKAICFRLSQDPRYETELNLSFQKGLIIRGTPGIGKSYIPKLVSNNPVCNIQFLTMPQIIASVMATGDFREMNFGKHRIVYFDDVGTEHEKGHGVVKYMGTPINWFKSYIEEYYAKYPNQYNRLMFSTNDNFSQLEEKYGFRVRSRLAEMFDVIDVNGNDMRRA
jgi:DNA replication protein DnaC